MAAHKLVLKTVSGDTRNLAFSDDTEFLINAKPTPLSKLAAGLHVAARIRHEAGDEVVWRITVEAAKKRTVTKKPAPAGRATAAPH